MPAVSSASSTAKSPAICGRRAMLLEAVRLALRAIGRSKLRSFLTVLGIIIGVAAVGTDNDYLLTQDWLLQQGREFYDTELRGGRAACIVGATVVRKLFGGADGVGRNIRVASVSCEVIGVLEAKGQSGFGMDQD